MFKRWTAQYFAGTDFAPSYYVESAVHQVASSKFNPYLPLSFVTVGLEICSWSRYTVIHSVAGDKDILVTEEWNPNKFAQFQTNLLPDLKLVVQAMQAATAQGANRLFKLAFGEPS
jgi:hypothetical protein